MKLWIAATVTLLTGSGVIAQVADDVLSSRAFSLRGPSAAGLVWFESANDAGPAMAKLMTGFDTSSHTVALPMTHCTGAVLLGVSPWSCVVAGMSYDAAGGNRQGVLAQVVLGANGFSIAQQVTTPSVWPVSLCKGPGGLAIVDGKSRSVCGATYSPGGVLPTNWTVMLSAQQAPELGVPGYLAFTSLAAREDVLTLRTTRGSVYERRGHVSNGAVTWQSPVARRGVLDVCTLAGNRPVAVSLADNVTTAEVRRSDGTVLHALSGVAGSWLTLPGIPEAVIHPGEKLEVHYPAAPHLSFHVRPGVRYGEPSSLPELEIGSLVCRSAWTVGDPQPAFSFGARRTAMSTGNVICVLNLAFRANGVDPVTTGVGPSGQQALLNAVGSVVFVCDTTQVLDSVGQIVDLGLTEEDVGGVVLAQYIVLGGNGAIGISDVASMTVVAPPEGARVSGFGGRSTGSGGQGVGGLDMAERLKALGSGRDRGVAVRAKQSAERFLSRR